MKAMNSNLALVVKWKSGQNPGESLPRSVVWEDGTPATIDDYLAHIADTNTLCDGPEGPECRIFPDIEADVRYDVFAHTWVLSRTGIDSMSLELADPQATDEQIISALYACPVAYRARIHR